MYYVLRARLLAGVTGHAPENESLLFSVSPFNTYSVELLSNEAAMGLLFRDIPKLL